MPNKRLSQTQSTSDESTDLNPRNTQIDEKYLYDDQIDTLELEDELEESEEDDETYEVEEIQDKKLDGKVLKYLVKWKGWEDPTWESEHNLDCPKLVKEFEERQRIKHSREAKSRTKAAIKNYRSDSESLSDFIVEDNGNGKNKKAASSNTHRDGISEKTRRKHKITDELPSVHERKARDRHVEDVKNSSVKNSSSESSGSSYGAKKKKSSKGTVLNPVNDILTTDDDDVDIYDDVSYHTLPKKNEANKKKIPAAEIKSHRGWMSNVGNKFIESKKPRKDADANLSTNFMNSDENCPEKSSVDVNKSEMNFDLETLQYVVIDDDKRNGFSDKLQIEKVLAFNYRQRDGITCAVIKFKGAKYPQQISMKIFAEKDRIAFGNAYRDLLTSQYKKAAVF